MKEANNTKQDDYITQALEPLSDSLKDFKQRMRDQAPPISTGIDKIDELLGGGLRKGVYLMCSAPSVGKTTLVLQIADNIAQGGRNVLFFNLLTDPDELMLKSMSRITYELTTSSPDYTHDTPRTMREVEQAVRSHKINPQYTTANGNIFQEAYIRYERLARNLYFDDCGKRCCNCNILKSIENNTKANGVPPVIIVDYLQDLAMEMFGGMDERSVGKTIAELNTISDNYNVPVICTSHIPRKYYNRPMEIEGLSYTVRAYANIIIAVSYDDPKAIATGKQRQPVKVNYDVLKNILGEHSRTMLDYNQPYNYFC